MSQEDIPFFLPSHTVYSGCAADSVPWAYAFYGANVGHASSPRADQHTSHPDSRETNMANTAILRIPSCRYDNLHLIKTLSCSDDSCVGWIWCVCVFVCACICLSMYLFVRGEFGSSGIRPPSGRHGSALQRSGREVATLKVVLEGLRLE